MIIPKQWKHWCAEARLKQHGRGQKGGPKQWMYLKGRGRIWRINAYAMFQCGDRYKDFDRWALCKIHECPMPQSREEFRQAIRNLLRKKAQYDAEQLALF